MNRIKCVVNGASGRMGQLVCNLLFESAQLLKEIELVAALTHDKSVSLGVPCCDDEEAPAYTSTYGGVCDVIIDFSTEAGTAKALQIALLANSGLLVATTGLSADIKHALEVAGRKIPVLIAPNTSIGVTALRSMLQQLVPALTKNNSDLRIDISEAHHQYKKDQPSGTALLLGNTIINAGGKLDADSNYHCMRGGDVVGEHIIRLASDCEYIEIKHVATSRTLFAHGAINAAKWLARQNPGYYSMSEVLGL